MLKSNPSTDPKTNDTVFYRSEYDYDQESIPIRSRIANEYKEYTRENGIDASFFEDRGNIEK
jgi:hypothetical protein